MTQERPIRATRRTVRLAVDRYRAYVLDMDGVVTDTAATHERAWRELFDGYLHERAERDRQAYHPFSTADYRRYVDGRPRADGVVSFLASRGITLPAGEDGDPPDRETVHGLANRKNDLFLADVAAHGVIAFSETVALLRRLRAAGVRTAVVTASRNAGTILDAAGVADLFDARVDGTDAARLGLPGKPEPATFLRAAALLGVDPGDAVVVEDALSGVRAGARGGFGLVIGIAREGGVRALARYGAHVVVHDLGDIELLEPDPGCRLCAQPGDAQWTLSYLDGEPTAEGTREALLTLANGYQGCRGAVPEAHADAHHYPGVYVAGTYNRLRSVLDGRPREDESMVNLPNWLPLTIRLPDGRWLDPRDTPPAHHHLSLDLSGGVLYREALWIDEAGRRTRVRQRRLVSMACPHLSALDTVVIAENWSGPLRVRSSLDARVRNANVPAFQGLARHHLAGIGTGVDDADPAVMWLVGQTNQSRVRFAQAARLRVTLSGGPAGDSGDALAGDSAGAAPADQPVVFDEVEPEHGVISREFTVDLAAGARVTVTKTVATFTSRDPAISEPLVAALAALEAAPGCDDLCRAHEAAWTQLWRHCHIDLSIGHHLGLAVNLDIFHVLGTLSAHTADQDAGVPARGLHGEGYRGHVFWDEMFVLPFLTYRLPELTRSLLRYRYRRLPAARGLAGRAGRAGAMFPWQSGSDGREETPVAFFNPFSGRWLPDHSHRQHHVSLAVAYNVWHYWQITGDLDFMLAYGAEMLAEIARFCASATSYDADADRYHIRGVMGPDEFHDGYPDRPGEGIDNSAYLNVMVAWTLTRAHETYHLLGAHNADEVWRRLGLEPAEVDTWARIASRLRVPFLSNGLVAQFDGYADLAELDWESYRDTYGEIGRLDLILESEGDDVRRYKASKQADVLMLLYLFDAAELTGLLRRMGYPFDPDTIPATVEYYLARTSHGSTLSRVAHAWVLARTNRRASWRMLHEALDSDLEDEGGTTREGIHLGAIGGALDILQRCYTGLDARDGALWLNPLLPDELQSLRLDIRYHGQWLDLKIDHEQTTVRALPCAVPPITVHVHERPYQILPGTSLTVRNIRPPARSRPSR